MTYKLIALDVDGTLIDDHHVLTERTKEVLKRAHQAGIQIVLCSGRSPKSIFPILEEIGFEGTAIAHNGAATVLSHNSELIHEFAFSAEEITPLIHYCRENQIHFDVSTAFDLFVESCRPEEREMYAKFFIDPIVREDATTHDQLVKMTLSAESDVMDRVEAQLRDHPVASRFHMIRSGDFFIDFMHKEATKGNALEALAASWNIPREQIIAIGNYYNDIEMLEFAGLGIAMDNSPEAVKQAADAVTLSNNEDGVAAALEKYCLNA
ncbi:Cof-type HAD-IIB family hydrolase [Paenibacillus sp. N1-5-1-14]|uniref:Cof-type HAD-IIB family hydrolase n=1 Tax=Paenibacillus radicibacter TaxID=2972488 RepID=UPI002158C6A4|nr:Cof-type HAD-IIB family hydrolase [Paenibacillus radicibacter]MCR8643911.1 Cof-type HAD-IIB family hydrolase [Paenibacillus radicibacter]